MDKEVQDLLRGGVNDLENGLYYTGLQKLKDVLAKVEADPAKPEPEGPDLDDLASDSTSPVYDEESSSSDYEESDGEDEFSDEPEPDEDEDSFSDEFSDEDSEV